MKIKSVVELSDYEATAITVTLAILKEIIEHAEKRNIPEFNDTYTIAEKAMIALKDFYKECYL